MGTSDTAIVAQDIVLEFGERRIIDRISCQFKRHQITVLMGPSGAGKSSLLGVLSGQIEPTSGSVHHSEELRIEWIMQSSPMLMRRSVIENALLSAKIVGISDSDAIRAKANNVLSAVGIDHLSQSPTYLLSGGERQRLAVARAMVVGAPIILADEPTASLDDVSKDLVIRSLVTAAERGAAVVVATHDHYVTGYANRTLILSAGRLIEQ